MSYNYGYNYSYPQSGYQPVYPAAPSAPPVYPPNVQTPAPVYPGQQQYNYPVQPSYPQVMYPCQQRPCPQPVFSRTIDPQQQGYPCPGMAQQPASQYRSPYCGLPNSQQQQQQQQQQQNVYSQSQGYPQPSAPNSQARVQNYQQPVAAPQKPLLSFAEINWDKNNDIFTPALKQQREDQQPQTGTTNNVNSGSSNLVVQSGDLHNNENNINGYSGVPATNPQQNEAEKVVYDEDGIMCAPVSDPEEEETAPIDDSTTTATNGQGTVKQEQKQPQAAPYTAPSDYPAPAYNVAPTPAPVQAPQMTFAPIFADINMSTPDSFTQEASNKKAASTTANNNPLPAAPTFPELD